MKNKKLTTLEAANIGRKMGVRGLCIYRDDIDRDLWHVVTPGRNEVHEPMDETTWRKFITDSGWITKTYSAKRRDGRTVRVTVPETPHATLYTVVTLLANWAA